MKRPLRFCFIMSTEVGLRTQYLNWRDNFPDNLGIEPTWVVIDFHREGGRIEKLPAPQWLRARLRGQAELAAGLKQGPFDATFIAVHSAMAMRPHYLRRNVCALTFDVTPKQLHGFGDFYGKRPSAVKQIEAIKHRVRSVAYQECRLLFPWSKWAAQSAVQDYGASQDRIFVNPPGVDTGRWSPGDQKAKASKKQCDILFVGGDFDRKGGRLLLEWVSKTTASGWKLHLVTRQRLELVDSRICVYNDLNSNDAKLMELYRNADLFVLPTLADCYSIAGVEALSSGVPVILSETGGTGDVIRNGETGYLIRPNDSGHLAETIEKLIADPALRRAMGEAGRLDALERYDAAKNIRLGLERIKEIL